MRKQAHYTQPSGEIEKVLARRTGDEGRGRVARAIKARRIELDLTQEQLATAAGLSLRTVQHAEDEDGPVEMTDRTKQRLARALRWPAERLDSDQDSDELEPAAKRIMGLALSPTLQEILDDDRLTPEMRQAILQGLLPIIEDYARDVSRIFRLQPAGNGDDVGRSGDAR